MGLMMSGRIVVTRERTGHGSSEHRRRAPCPHAGSRRRAGGHGRHAAGEAAERLRSRGRADRAAGQRLRHARLHLGDRRPARGLSHGAPPRLRLLVRNHHSFPRSSKVSKSNIMHYDRFRLYTNYTTCNPVADRCSYVVTTSSFL